MSAPIRLRDRVGLNIPPLLLRFMLGIVFVWAGLGKVSQTMEVSGESAAVLANMGVLGPVSPPPPPAATPKVEPAKPTEAKPPESKPTEPAAPASKPESTSGGGTAALWTNAPRILLAHRQPAPKILTAADFPAPIHVRMLYSLAIMIHNAANPVADAGGAAKMPLWPASLAGGSTPVYLAWSVAITELAGGICLLLGLLTRLAALGIAGVMLGAMWLTQIGPAVQSGKAVLGFLPDFPPFDPQWMPLMFQFSLCAAALALAFCGPGRLSLDTALLSGGGGEDDED